MNGTSAKVNTGTWLSKGWDLFRQDVGNFVLIALLFAVLTSFGNIIVLGPLEAGFFLACIRKMVKGKAELGDLFSGFNFFLESLIASVLILVFVSVGLILCIIPGFVVYAMYLFTYLFIVDRKMDFWQAMEASRKLVASDYFGFTLFGFLLLLINLIGLCLAGVGLFFTLPWTTCAITVAYQELVGFQEQPPPQPLNIP